MSDSAVKTMSKTPDNIPIQCIVLDGASYLISQLRICRNCEGVLGITDGNHRLYFDKEKRLALHEHIKCPDSDMFWA